MCLSNLACCLRSNLGKLPIFLKKIVCKKDSITQLFCSELKLAPIEKSRNFQLSLMSWPNLHLLHLQKSSGSTEVKGFTQEKNARKIAKVNCAYGLNPKHKKHAQ